MPDRAVICLDPKNEEAAVHDLEHVFSKGWVGVRWTPDPETGKIYAVFLKASSLERAPSHN
jgi:hypothetical protein